MKHPYYAAGLISVMAPLQGSATTPPLPKPNPVALNAARQLVDRLPLDRVVTQELESQNAKDALAWLQRTNPNASKDGELTRLFAAKVALAIKSNVPTCMPEAKENLAIWFSWHVSPEDSRNITWFLATKSGQALAPAIAIQPFVETLRTCTFRAVSANFPAILDTAIESNDLRRRVNSSHPYQK